MLRKLARAGAFASVATFVVVLVGVQGSAADAQDPVAAVATELSPAEGEMDPKAQPAVRFVAQEVVQELPEDNAQGNEAVPEPSVAAGDAENLRELVAATPVDDQFPRELHCLAQGVYFESRGEPIDGQLAVAQVIVNRAASGQFPDDYCSVITQPAQFSFVRGGQIPEPNTSSAAWKRAKAIARIAHREMWQSEAGDALYFHAAHVSPRWARTMTARAKIDRHIFYR